MAIFGTGGGYRHGNINCPSFGNRSCTRTKNETNGTFGVYGLPIGPSFDFGSTKFVPTRVDALTVFCEHCKHAPLSSGNPQPPPNPIGQFLSSHSSRDNRRTAVWGRLCEPDSPR